MQRPVAGGPFDIIVLDPPYDYAALEDAVRHAGEQRAADGVVVLEHASRVTPPAAEKLSGLALTRTVKSGDSALTFYS